MPSSRPPVCYMRILAIVAMAIFVIGCASRPDVSWDYDPSVSLAGLRYYNWYPDEREGNSLDDRGYDTNSLVQDRVESAINMVLHSQGYREVNNRRSNNRNLKADFYVNASYMIMPTYEGVQIPGYLPPPYSTGSMPTGSVRNYEEGILTIDVIDPDSNQVVWSGSAWSRINKFATPQQKVTNITNTVQRILSGFPRPQHSQYIHPQRRHSRHAYLQYESDEYRKQGMRNNHRVSSRMHNTRYH